jgi:hypothetical protein
MTDTKTHPSFKSLTLLSCLLFRPLSSDSAPGTTEISQDGFQDLLTLANSHHVIVRGMEAALDIVRDAGDETRVGWALAALDRERARITNAITFLNEICTEFRKQGYDILVIKSLDHWPDLGSDLDLYTNADAKAVLQLLRRRFEAQVAPRSWGDRLASKWNFLIPGLPEAVEIHVGRLGQTGEQVALASRLFARSGLVRRADYIFPVPAASDRLLISTLQRMYRHFYFRLCDIMDTATLSEAGVIDYEDLRSSATDAGIWEGTATYLAIVSDYLTQYRDYGLNLPSFVTTSARVGGDELYFRRGFLRVPIVPQSARLYGSQLTSFIGKRNLRSSARLGLLPWLATAAAVGQKITGSDKGIW